MQAVGFADVSLCGVVNSWVQLDDTLQRAEVKQAQRRCPSPGLTTKRNQELVAQNFVAQRVLDESTASLQVVRRNWRWRRRARSAACASQRRLTVRWAAQRQCWATT